MIKNLSGGPGILVQAGSSSYPYVNMSNVSAGMIRYNGNNQNFEVYDGSSWLSVSGNYTQIELDADTKSLLEWARARRAEEEYLEKQAKNNSTIKDLIDQRNEIDNKITMVKTLLQGECKVCEQ